MSDGIRKIPAEFVEDIFENGIILTGGGAEIFGLDTMMNKVFDISVTCPAEPINSVAKGLSRINNIIPDNAKTDGKNVTAMLAKYYESKSGTN